MFGIDWLVLGLLAAPGSGGRATWGNRSTSFAPQVDVDPRPLRAPIMSFKDILGQVFVVALITAIGIFSITGMVADLRETIRMIGYLTSPVFALVIGYLWYSIFSGIYEDFQTKKMIREGVAIRYG